MDYENMQKKEIETIKKHQLVLSLSDADVERLCEKTAAVGITPETLLENFIGDLVDGTYSNGSDERMYAEQWFERCWFSLFAEKTFVCYLAQEGMLEEVINSMETVELLEEETEDLDVYRQEVEAAREVIRQEWESFLKWKNPDTEAGTLEEELLKLKEWQEHRHVIELEYERREEAESLREEQLQDAERESCGIKKVR